jgi:hypothetical protein
LYFGLCFSPCLSENFVIIKIPKFNVHLRVVSAKIDDTQGRINDRGQKICRKLLEHRKKMQALHSAVIGESRLTIIFKEICKKSDGKKSHGNIRKFYRRGPWSSNAGKKEQHIAAKQSR